MTVIEVLQLSLIVFEMKYPKPSPTGTPGYDLVSTMWDTTPLKVASSHVLDLNDCFENTTSIPRKRQFAAAPT